MLASAFLLPAHCPCKLNCVNPGCSFMLQRSPREITHDCVGVPNTYQTWFANRAVFDFAFWILFALVVVRGCVCLGAGCQALNPNFTHTKHTLYRQVLPLVNKTVLQISGNGWIYVTPTRSREFRTLLLRKTPSRNIFHAAAGVLHKPDSGEV